MRIFDLDKVNIDEKWLLNFISTEFTKPGENITPLKILAKLGVNIHDQSGQLQNKVFIYKFDSLLKVLKEQGFLALEENDHDTLGIKETAYKLGLNL